MSPRLFEEWRSERRLKRAIALFVENAMSDPDAADTTWLATVACSGDHDRASWELRYARRALALVIAQRDALDDRIPSLVARAIADAVQSDRNVAPAMLRVAERQFNDRLSTYRDVIAARVAPGAQQTRLGRTLLQTSGIALPPEEHVARAGDILARYVNDANESLRSAFGAPTILTPQPPPRTTP